MSSRVSNGILEGGAKRASHASAVEHVALTAPNIQSSEAHDFRSGVVLDELIHSGHFPAALAVFVDRRETFISSSESFLRVATLSIGLFERSSTYRQLLARSGCLRPPE